MQCIETPRKLSHRYEGQTGKDAAELLKKCVGKVLLLDEANSFGNKEGKGFAPSAATAIINHLDENMGKTIMMVAGETVRALSHASSPQPGRKSLAARGATCITAPH
jgi:hypothetical protein